MTTKKKCVMAVLANLEDVDFKSFCIALVDRDGDKKVARNKVQKKDYLDVTNVLVSTFTEDGTPAVVAELLRSIGCCNEADKLDAEIKKHFSNSSASKATAATAAAGAPGGTTCSSEEHFVIKHRVRLIESVTNIDAILNRLLEKKAIPEGIYEQISNTNGNQEKMTKIYRLALKSSNRAKDIFLEILKAQEPLLVDELENQA